MDLAEQHLGFHIWSQPQKRRGLHEGSIVLCTLPVPSSHRSLDLKLAHGPTDRRFQHAIDAFEMAIDSSDEAQQVNTTETILRVCPSDHKQFRHEAKFEYEAQQLLMSVENVRADLLPESNPPLG